MTRVPSITLNNGVSIPQVGLGVFKIPEAETETVVTSALELGYRSIDTAKIYGNEAGVGNAIANFTGPRDDLFVTTKLWNGEQGYDSTLRAFDGSMEKLQLDVLDLYPIHWPCPSNGLFKDTWRAFEKLYADGRIRAIGVSNFRIEDLQALIGEFSIVPAVNQVEFHPGFQQPELRAFHAEHGIVTEAWAPLGQGGALASPEIAGIAATYGKTPAQVILRWHIQIGAVAIPKSVRTERLAENLDIFDFEMSDDDMAQIATLDTGKRIGGDPSVVAMPV